MLLLLFALSGPVIEPPQPPEAPTTYYGSGKAKGKADLLQKVLDKYSVIEKNRADDQASAEKAAIQPEPTQNEPKAAAKQAAKAIIDAIKLPALERPQATKAKQAAEDDQIMALMALMLLED